LLSKFSLNDFARRVLVVLERFAHVCQQRASDEIIALDRNAAPERFLKHIGNGNALSRTGIEMLDEGHLNVAGQQCELTARNSSKVQPFPPQPVVIASFHTDATFFAQRFVLDPLQAKKELRNLM
jgi:hypothetical protein